MNIAPPHIQDVEKNCYILTIFCLGIKVMLKTSSLASNVQILSLNPERHTLTILGGLDGARIHITLE